MMSIIIVLVLVSITMPLFVKRKELIIGNDDKIVFEFYKDFKIIMLVCTMVFIIVSLVMFIVALCNNKKDMLIGVIFFELFALPCLLLYLTAKNKKIIYEDNTLYVYNIIGRLKKFNIQDLKEFEFPYFIESC